MSSSARYYPSPNFFWRICQIILPSHGSWMWIHCQPNNLITQAVGAYELSWTPLSLVIFHSHSNGLAWSEPLVSSEALQFSSSMPIVHVWLGGQTPLGKLRVLRTARPAASESHQMIIPEQSFCGSVNLCTTWATTQACVCTYTVFVNYLSCYFHVHIMQDQTQESTLEA